MQIEIEDVNKYLMLVRACTSLIDKDNPSESDRCVQFRVDNNELRLEALNRGMGSISLVVAPVNGSGTYRVVATKLEAMTKKVKSKLTLLVKLDTAITYTANNLGSISEALHTSNDVIYYDPRLLSSILSNSALPEAAQLLSQISNVQSPTLYELHPNQSRLTKRVSSSSYLQVEWNDVSLTAWSGTFLPIQLATLSHIGERANVSISNNSLIAWSSKGVVTLEAAAVSSIKSDCFTHVDNKCNKVATFTINASEFNSAIDWQSYGKEAGAYLMLDIQVDKINISNNGGSPATIPITLDGEPCVSALSINDLTTNLSKIKGEVEVDVYSVTSSKPMSIFIFTRRHNNMVVRSLLVEPLR